MWVLTLFIGFFLGIVFTSLLQIAAISDNPKIDLKECRKKDKNKEKDEQ